jgi:uncharacterized protein
MRTDNGRESDNVEDRRDSSSGGGGISLGKGKLGIGTIVIAFAASYFLGINPMTVLSILSGGGSSSGTVQEERVDGQKKPRANDSESKLVSVVLADTEDVWNKEFSNLGKTYQEPKLVLFRNSTPTACGTGEAAMGPFYCPGDKKIYIDLGFFEEMKSRFNAPGDFAQAYVIAHEVGHHIQNLLGTSSKVQRAKQKVSEAKANALSVRLELQADCYAGVWGNHANKARSILESGDLEEALNAATQIGDDTLQKNSGRGVVPESFTHGSSAQRSKWFRKGIDSGDIKACDTFETEDL